MRHIISILMANEAVALVRVAGMFSQRGFNIETLNVAPTEDPSMSRLTLVTEGTNNVIEQINRQLLKLVDVIDVLDMTGDEHLELELALIKVRTDRDAAALETLTQSYDILSLGRDGSLQTLRFLGPGEALNRFVADLEAMGWLVELVRSGAVTITPGGAGLRYRHRETSADGSSP